MPGRASSNGFEGTPATRDEVLAVLETFAGRLAYSPDIPGFDVPKEGTSYPMDFEVLADEHPEARWFLLSPERSEVLAAEREAEVESANAEADRRWREWSEARGLSAPDVVRG